MIDDHETYGLFGRSSSSTHRAVRRVAFDPAGGSNPVTYVELVHDGASPVVVAQAVAAPGQTAHLPYATRCPVCTELVDRDGRSLTGTTPPPHWTRRFSSAWRAQLDRETRALDRHFRTPMQYGTVAGLLGAGVDQVHPAGIIGMSPEQRRQRAMRARVLARRRLMFPPVGARPANQAAHTAGRVCRSADDGRLRRPGSEHCMRMLADVRTMIETMMRPSDVIRIDPY